MTQNPQTIIELQAQNVKRLSAVTIHPNGQPVVIIGGRNGQGKTSVLDAIQWAFAGKSAMPDEPIRAGQARATIIAKTQDYLIERRIAPSGSTVTVTAADGGKLASPQAVLDKLTSDIAFDPLAFLRQKPRDQARTLQALIGLDVEGFATRRKAIYDQRASANLTLKNLEAKQTQLHPNLPDQEQSASALAERLRAAERNAAMRATALRDLDNINAEIKRMEAALAQAKTKHDQVRAALDNMPAPTSTEDLAAQIRDIEATNAKIRHNAAQKQVAAEVEKWRAESQRLTKALEQADADERAAVAAVKLPVPGLSVDADQVRLNGVPLAQASQAEQIRVGVAIAMAQRPGVRVALVRDGSLLDDDSLAALAAAAAEHGAQVWVERVGRGKEVSVVIEDGQVVGASAPQTETVKVEKPSDQPRHNVTSEVAPEKPATVAASVTTADDLF
jgi:hypothetical protein